VPDLHDMPTLIERRHQQTRTAIADAAVALFIERGFVETTMDEVAQAAGVSRRTAYRHFPSKDDLVFEQPRQWLQHFNVTITDRRANETPRQRCRRGLIAVAALIQANAVSVLPAYSVFVATPSLRGSNGRIQDDWFERYLELLTPRRRVSPARALQIATVAGALVGTTTMLVAMWAASQPEADIITMTTAALDQLDPIWPEWLDK
jgi:AcrR family transcriptional regulator